MGIFSYLPTQGDERYVGTSGKGWRQPSYAYLQQIAQAQGQKGAVLACLLYAAPTEERFDADRE